MPPILKSKFRIEYTMRLCLGFCGKSFRSTGPSNRICATCKGRQPNLSVMEYKKKSKADVELGVVEQ